MQKTPGTLVGTLERLLAENCRTFNWIGKYSIPPLGTISDSSCEPSESRSLGPGPSVQARPCFLDANLVVIDVDNVDDRLQVGLGVTRARLMISTNAFRSGPRRDRRVRRIGSSPNPVTAALQTKGERRFSAI